MIKLLALDLDGTTLNSEGKVPDVNRVASLRDIRDGTSHTFLLKPGVTTAQGVPLWTWLTQFVNDDAAWTSTKP